MADQKILTGNPVPSADPRDRYDNSIGLDEAIMSVGNSWVDRLGRIRRTLYWMERAATGIPAVEAADRAETAAAAAQLSAGIFDSTALGLAGTTNGKYFSVPQPGNPSTALMLYKNNAGAAQYITSYATGEASSLTINYGKTFPNRRATRNFINSPDNTVLNDFVLDASVIGAEPGYYYRIGYYVNGNPSYPQSPDGWAIERISATNYSAADNPAEDVIKYTDQAPEIGPGIQTVVLTSKVYPDLKISLTVDGSKRPARGTPITTRLSTYAGYSHIIDPSVYIENTRKTNGSALTQLNKALRNPFHSVCIAGIGDSITNGSGASYVPGANPNPIYDVPNAKINFAVRSWINRYRENLGLTYAGGDVIQDDKGLGYYEKLHIVDVLDNHEWLDWYDGRTGVKIPPPVPQTTGGTFMKFVDLQSFLRPTIEVTGDHLTVIHASFTTTDAPADTMVDVWDTLTDTKVGEFTWAGPTTTFGTRSKITFPWGKYRLQLRPTRATSRCRFEGFEVTQRIQVRNIGVSGSGTISWQPGTTNMNQLLPEDEFVTVMLGTNDRGSTALPANYARYKRDLLVIVDYLKSQGKKVILMCASVAVKNAEFPNSPYRYSMSTVMRVIREVSQERGLSFVDHYTPTQKAYLDGEVIFSNNDNLHPNDLGHKYIHDSLWQRTRETQE